MRSYVIEESTREEYEMVDNGIIEYNLSKVPFTQEPSFISINKVIKGLDGNVLAGINSMLYCWNCLYIDVLWVKGTLDKLYSIIPLSTISYSSLVLSSIT